MMKISFIAVSVVAMSAMSVAQAAPAEKTDAAATPKQKSATTKSSGGATKTKTTRVRGTSYTRIVHAIAGGPAVDFYVDGKKVLSNVVYKSASDYLPLTSGKHALKITASGKTDALLSAELANVKDKFYSVAAYGTPEKPLLLRVNESTGKMLDGKARIYVMHLAQAPAVDVTTPSTRTKAGYASFLKELQPGTARSKSAAPGNVKLQIRADGKIAKETDAKIELGKRYTVFALGKAGENGAQALDLLVKSSADTPVVTP